MRRGLAQVHQDLVLNAPGRVRGKLDLFFRIERVNCLDEADGSNRNQILHTNSCIIKFLCNVDDETQVVFDQRRTRLFILTGSKFS